MAWPPPIPPNTRANTTPQLDDHADDHNALADGLSEVVDLLSNRTPIYIVTRQLGSQNLGSASGDRDLPDLTWEVPDLGASLYSIAAWHQIYLNAAASTNVSIYLLANGSTLQRSANYTGVSGPSWLHGAQFGTVQAGDVLTYGIRATTSAWSYAGNQSWWGWILAAKA